MMEWAITLNRHRLYDTWQNGLADVKFSNAANSQGLWFIERSLASGNLYVAVAGSLAGAIICLIDAALIREIANTMLAFNLWVAVKIYECVAKVFFPDRSQLDIFPKELLFLNADMMPVDDRVNFLSTQTCDTIIAYLSDRNFKRLHSILQEYQGDLTRLPPKWEEAIYSIALSVRELSFDDAPRLRMALPKLVKTFSRLEKLNAHKCRLEAASFSHIGKLYALSSLKINDVELRNQSTVLQNLHKLHHLETLELDLTEPLLPSTLLQFVENMPRLRALKLQTQSLTTLTSAHMQPLLRLQHLTKLELSGHFLWENRAALAHVEQLTHLTDLVLEMSASSNLGNHDTFSLQPLVNLTRVKLRHIPLHDHNLQELRQHAPHLKILSIADCTTLTPTGFLHLMAEREGIRRPALTALTIKNCEGADASVFAAVIKLDSLKRLAFVPRRAPIPFEEADEEPLGEAVNSNDIACKELTHLTLTHCLINKTILQAISEAAPLLIALDLSHSATLQNEDLEPLIRLQNLQRLVVDNCSQLDDRAVERYISRVSTLSHFSASDTAITAASWQHWSTHPHLKSLCSLSIRVTAAYIPHLPRQLESLDLYAEEHLNLQLLAEQCPYLKTLYSPITLSTTATVTDITRFHSLERLTLQQVNLPAEELQPISQMRTVKRITVMLRTPNFFVRRVPQVLPPPFVVQRYF